ncbi:MAG: FxsA family protein [Candidatus Scalindua sp.]|nr:FxsA family protein [Candidatus Scalindua sp.]
MLFRLIILFTVVPLMELYLLLHVGKYLGAFLTILIVVLTGIFGGLLARGQGLSIYQSIRKDLESGIIPTDGLLEGLFILVAGALLITPGLVTDIVGFLLMVPVLRKWVQNHLKNRLKRNFETRQIHIYSHHHSSDGRKNNRF